jgi:hypothetical protein
MALEAFQHYGLIDLLTHVTENSCLPSVGSVGKGAS